MNFFSSAMRNAAMILFVAAVLIVVVSFFMALAALPAFGSLPPGLVVGSTPLGSVWSLVIAVVNALNSAVLPFVGAGLLYRLDAWVEQRR